MMSPIHDQHQQVIGIVVGVTNLKQPNFLDQIGRSKYGTTGDFLNLLTEVGFESPSIEPTRIYKAEDAATFLTGAGLDAANVAEIDGKFMAGFVRATKPKAAACCAPGCCS